ncbi:hypothetical protein TPHA_0A00970 [Tetrapisispora phaffii CBS 4417]|uniref:protein-serine/threonine phosphatase n=1 Tax=Tetrapisispora phaffii (strain ATCC 24235 / CBS 4417 / NBRC 1672 / NRRL Y-8282 / UCD 70-5) TaxID=1071381 RepID=G8BMQ4_TETPH|nr:hypothetical protein TPHA_0A00970 [Tetrapisispora phaffii CBS 4417]CCE61182.1 hypothetical protein TPHA_0A00970 [Tetrapisispora phaffii CBS 4417]
MGQILSNPVTEKNEAQNGDVLTSYGFSDMQGWRMSMEDSHIADLNILSKLGQSPASKDHIAFYSIFDGHGGSNVSKFCGEKVVSILLGLPSFTENINNDSRKSFSDILVELYLNADIELLKDPVLKNDHSGCTATSILVSDLQKKIYCANSGDSRTVLSTDAAAKALSYDHKPTLASERSRIVAAKGFVEMDRVNGNLALSRALGDFEFKSNDELSAHEQIVTCVPDIAEHNIDYDNDEFVILACDGIWDCLTSQECVDLVHWGIKNTKLNLQEISSKIIDVCCAPTTEGTGIGCDNMSITIVALLKDGESTEQWFDRIRSKNHASHLSFGERKRAIFTYFQFPPFDPKVDINEDPAFDVTLKKPTESLDDHGAGDNKVAPNGRPRLGGPNGPVDLFSLEALLGASGIQLSPVSGGEDGDANSQFAQGTALSEMLASLTNAASAQAAASANTHCEGEDEDVELKDSDDKKFEEIN